MAIRVKDYLCQNIVSYIHNQNFKKSINEQGQQLSHRAKLLRVTIRKIFVFCNHEYYVNYGIKKQAEKVLK